MGAQAAQVESHTQTAFSHKGEPVVDWLRHPKSFVDELISKGKLAPGIELAILLVIERWTWGAEGKPEYLHITQAQLARLCHVSDAAVADPLKRLEKAGIITSIPKGETKPGEKRGYRLTPENWHSVRPYKDPATLAAEQEEKKAKTMMPPVGFDPDQDGAFTLLPGGYSRPTPRHIALRGQPEIDLPISYRNEVDLSLAFASLSTPQGLTVIVRRAAGEEANSHNGHNGHGRSKGEQKPIEDETQLHHSGEEYSQVVDNNHSHKTPLRDKASLPTSVEEYRQYFEPIFLHELKKPLDEPFLKQLVAAGQGAPATDFDQTIQKLRKSKQLTSGMILTVAKDIGQAYLARLANPQHVMAAGAGGEEEESPLLKAARKRFGNV